MADRQILTNSSLSTFRACPRKFQIQYEMGYRPVKEAEYLSFGKLMHRGIEVWSKDHKLKDAITAIYDMAEKTAILDEFLVAKAHALMEGYHAKYWDEPYVMVAVEKQFFAPVLNPETARESQNFVNSGVLDGLLQKIGSKNYTLKEIKTTSENIEDPTSDYWLNLQIDSQVSHYYLGAEALGFPVETCLYDVCRRPALQPYKATPLDKRNYKKDGTLYASQRDRDETVEEFFQRIKLDIELFPNKYYARREVPRLKTDLEDYMEDEWQIAQTIRTFQKKGKFPRYTRSCISLYGTCPMFPVCTGRASLEDTTLYKKVDSVHQELPKKEMSK